MGGREVAPCPQVPTVLYGEKALETICLDILQSDVGTFEKKDGVS